MVKESACTRAVASTKAIGHRISAMARASSGSSAETSTWATTVSANKQEKAYFPGRMETRMMVTSSMVLNMDTADGRVIWVRHMLEGGTTTRSMASASRSGRMETSTKANGSTALDMVKARTLSATVMSIWVSTSLEKLTVTGSTDGLMVVPTLEASSTV